MDNSRNPITPHTQFLDILFAFKSSVSKAFNDVIGLYGIDHFALSRINHNHELISLSSTPAMEFNLFRGTLWRYDQTYTPQWFKLGTQATWQTLYNPSRYDELYYLKQSKHAYPIGISLAQKIGEHHVIYSLATQSTCSNTQELFTNRQAEFYKIGQHCANQLNPILEYCDDLNYVDLALSA